MFDQIKLFLYVQIQSQLQVVSSFLIIFIWNLYSTIIINKEQVDRLIQLQRLGMTTLVCVREIVEIMKDQLSRRRELPAAMFGPHLI